MRTLPPARRALAKALRLRIVDRLDTGGLAVANHLRRLFRRCDVDAVFDVGGNQGQFAAMLRHDVGFDGRIITFEPIPAIAASLRRKAADDPAWSIEEVALSDRSGVAAFNVAATTEFSSLSASRDDEVTTYRRNAAVTEIVEVKTETLGDAFDRVRRDHRFERPYLKLDTQGYDVRIVQAARDRMREFVAFQSEVSVKKLYADSIDFREAISLYLDCGFEVSALLPIHESQFPLLVELDCIMIRDDLAGTASA